MAKEDNLNKGNKAHAFTSENQPTTEAKLKGKAKASLLRKVASTIIKGGVKDAVTPLAKYLGIEVDQIDIEMVMHLKQIEKAVKEGDTVAYNAVMNRLLGRPDLKMDHDFTGMDKIKSIMQFVKTDAKDK